MRKLALALFATLSTLGAAPARAQAYVAQDIGLLWAAGQTVGYGINNSGQVAGMSLTPAGWRGFITGANGAGMTDLGTLGGAQSFAVALNDSGQVVGHAYTADLRTRAFITGPNGVGMSDLGTLGDADSYARGINASGQVVGYAGLHPFITGPNGAGMTDLGSLGYPVGRAYALNDSGQAVGFSMTAPASPDQAFITGTGGVGMSAAGGIGNGSTYAVAVNATGRVLITAYPPTGGASAFITGASGLGSTPLGGLGGDVVGALALNSIGQVVGYANTSAGGATRAFVTGPDGVGMLDLNSLVSLNSVILSDARGINDRGQILANGSDGRSYLLTPVPEPGAAVLLLAGLAFLARRARRGHVPPRSG